MIKSGYKIENEIIFTSFSNKELKYIDFIKRWIEVQKKYFQQMENLFKLNNLLKEIYTQIRIMSL